MTDHPRPRVLIVEDDGDTATLLKEVLENEGFEAVAATSNASVDGETRPRLIVVDRAVGRSLDDVLPEGLRTGGLKDVPVLLVSAAIDVEARAQAIGAAAYLSKPFEIDTFAATCRDLTA